jgi:hypothetical protein
MRTLNLKRLFTFVQARAASAAPDGAVVRKAVGRTPIPVVDVRP